MSYNVFADMGFEHPEMELLKCEIVRSLRDLLREKKITNEAASQLWGIPAAKVPPLFRGDWEDYSVERLLQFASALGGTVRVTIECYGESHDGVMNSQDAAPDEAKTLVLTA